MSIEVDELRREVAALRGEVASLRAIATAALEIANVSAESGLEHRMHTDEAIDKIGAAVLALAEANKRRTSDVHTLADRMNAVLDAGAPADPDADAPWRESLRPDRDDD